MRAPGTAWSDSGEALLREPVRKALARAVVDASGCVIWTSRRR
ncbi:MULTISPECIES: hypothetical protein [Amycolatopsis]|nr:MULTISPECIES: hypothetical protein [Amycolatopsis]OAP24001.1 hypothetical protein A4R44_05154 [Amycolatopsis sp. M39]